MERESLCSCGREKPELGCDLCRICREEYEERQYEREQADSQEGLYTAWEMLDGR